MNNKKDAPRRGRAKHPMQPIVRAKDGAIRFKRNAIVEYLVDWCAGFNGHAGYPRIDGPAPDLNELARMDFSQEDRAQLSQLLGYSVSGAPNLSRRQQDEADAAAERLQPGRNRGLR